MKFYRNFLGVTTHTRSRKLIISTHHNNYSTIFSYFLLKIHVDIIYSILNLQPSATILAILQHTDLRLAKD